MAARITLPDPPLATYEGTAFVCAKAVEPHNLKTPRVSLLDKRIQLWNTGHLYSAFTLPQTECPGCSEDKLRQYLDEDVILVEPLISHAIALEAARGEMQLVN